MGGAVSPVMRTIINSEEYLMEFLTWYCMIEAVLEELPVITPKGGQFAED